MVFTHFLKKFPFKNQSFLFLENSNTHSLLSPVTFFPLFRLSNFYCSLKVHWFFFFCVLHSNIELSSFISVFYNHYFWVLIFPFQFLGVSSPKLGLLARESLIFPSSEKVLFPLQSWKMFSSNRGFCVNSSFLSVHEECCAFCWCLLASIISDEKSCLF